MKDDRLYLRHILDAIDDVLAYSAAGRQAFFDERIRQDAVIRKIEVIGEATKHISETTRGARPDVRWREIAGMRDKMIHEYFGVNLEIVWAVVERDLPSAQVGSGGSAEERGIADRSGV